MRFPVFIAPYRRLLAIGLLSLLLHLLLLAWFDNAMRSPNVIDADAMQAAPLSLRLAQAVDPAATAPPADAGPAPDVADSATTARSVVAGAVEGGAQPESATAPAPTLDRVVDAPPTTTRTLRPRRYHVSQPPSARIGYRVTRGAGATPQDAGSAHLDWRSEGQGYRLEMDGVVGNMLSEGGFDDAGLAPERLEERRAGRSYHTVFDREHERPPEGIQDGASVLVQLAGMGRADADQMQDELTFWIGGPEGGSVQRYQVLGHETIDTGMGEMVTVHLVRPGSAHQARVDLWLAPQQAWLPVQIRVTAPGGAVHTQTLATIELAPDPA